LNAKIVSYKITIIKGEIIGVIDVNPLTERTSNIVFEINSLEDLFRSKTVRKVIEAKQSFVPNSEYIYMVSNGILKTYISDDEGNERFLWMLGKGSLIPTYTSKIQKRMYAVQNTTLVLLPKEELVNQFAKKPMLFEAFMEQIYNRYDEVMQKFIASATESSESRLRKLLYEVAYISNEGEKNIRLKNYLTRQDMAYYVGTHITNISKLITQLEDEGVLARDGREIIITDINLLKK